MADYDGVHLYVLDETNANTLTYALTEINGTLLPEEFEKRREVIDEMADPLIIAMFDEYRDLNKAFVILLKGSSKNPLTRRLLGPESI